jgi:4-carboxymuconolactone decarboxylase
MPRLIITLLAALILATGAARDAFGPNDTNHQGAHVNPATNPDDAKKSPRRPPRLAKPRIPPVQKEHWTEAQKAILEPMEKQGRLYNVFMTMANHPDLARDWLTFGGHILGRNRNTVPPRDREILILRIGWLCGAEYEWAQHVRVGKRVGLSDEDLEHIRGGPDAPGVSKHDRLLLKAVDELHHDSFISDETWNALAETFDTKQMMDLVFTVGQYNLVSMALNSFGVQLDPGLEGFPK